MRSLLNRRRLAAIFVAAWIVAGMTVQSAAGDHFSKNTVYVAAAPAYAAAPPAAAPAAYYAPAPAYYAAPAPAYYYQAPKHTHLKQPVVVTPYYYPPMSYGYPVSAYAPAAAYAPPAAYAPAPSYASPSAAAPMTPYSPASATASILPEAQKVLKLTPAVMGEFVNDMRKTYSANTETGLTRISSLRKAAEEKYKEFRGSSTTETAELTSEEKTKLDDVVELVVKEENDRLIQSNSRYSEGYDPASRPPYYYPYGSHYYYGW